MRVEKVAYDNELAELVSSVGVTRQGRGDPILELLEGYTAGFVDDDVERLMSLWDADCAERLTYVSVERNIPIFGLAALRNYYNELIWSYKVLEGEVSNIHVRFESEELAYVFCELCWGYVRRDAPVDPPYRYRARGTFLLRKRGGRWLCHQLHESAKVNAP